MKANKAGLIFAFFSFLFMACDEADSEIIILEDNSDFSEEESVEPEEDTTLRVNTMFVLEGLDSLPNNLSISSLYMNVGAVYLEPLTEEDGGFSFANLDPFSLHFDLSEDAIIGPEMVLPFGGDFVVSMQLEPSRDDARPTVEVEGSITRLRGHEKSSEDQDPEADPMPLPWREADPMPLPWRETDPMPLPWREADQTPLPRQEEAQSDNIEMIPFTYQSNQIVRITIDDVTLSEDGSYELLLAIRLNNWIDEIVIPAVQSQHDIDIPEENEEAVVVVEEVAGLEGLIGDINLSANIY